MTFLIAQYKDSKFKLVNIFESYETIEAALNTIKSIAAQEHQQDYNHYNHYEILKPRTDLVVVDGEIFERVKSITTTKQSAVKMREQWPNHGKEINE